MMNDGKKEDGMVTTLEPISLIPFMEFEDFEFFGKMRFIIGLKKKLILILKPFTNLSRNPRVLDV
jgi:hypothetical protein